MLCIANLCSDGDHVHCIRDCIGFRVSETISKIILNYRNWEASVRSDGGSVNGKHLDLLISRRRIVKLFTKQNQRLVETFAFETLHSVDIGRAEYTRRAQNHLKWPKCYVNDHFDLNLSKCLFLVLSKIIDNSCDILLHTKFNSSRFTRPRKKYVPAQKRCVPFSKVTSMKWIICNHRLG